MELEWISYYTCSPFNTIDLGQWKKWKPPETIYTIYTGILVDLSYTILHALDFNRKFDIQVVTCMYI